ncbi:MAG TPA: electron transfer flavoprotein subunit alpha/FixB family protein [Petrotogaceae bacterium]|nr:electron transfer flavoprotein subunit alpha/FixB family protein [Petrotogaceae bacterium]
MSKDIWTFARVINGRLTETSFELLTWGRSLADSLGSSLCSVFISSKIQNDEVDKLFLYGADKVYTVQDKKLENFIPDIYMKISCHMIKKYSPHVVIAPADTFGKTLMPMIASKLRTGLTADCTDLSIEDETGLLMQTRPAIGGNVMATIKTPYTLPQMATVRPMAKKPLKHKGSTREIVEEIVGEEFFASCYEYVGFRQDESSEIALNQAEVIVGGGRGMKDEKNFFRLYELAALLGGGVGASRAAVDMGWVTYPHQIGLSGKTVSPKVYFAFGISGAVQHIAGISGAEYVISVNKDPDSNIFNISDLSIIGDCNEVLEKLVKKLQETGAMIKNERIQ